jgi:two-component system, OmpR family, phosphate regulon sensor histidine kinase PhoR
MNWLPLLLAILLAVALAGLGWRSALLHRGMRAYTLTLRRAADGEKSLSDLPADEKGMEELSNAVKTLALTQKMQSDNLEAERARLAAVLEKMTDGVLIADSNGRVQFANPAAETLFTEGQPAAGRTVVEVLRLHQLVEVWKRSQESNQVQEESLEIPAKRQFLQLVVLPDREAGGSLLMVQNLTRVRRLETIRRDFISNLSHELRTPLASLKALTETLRDGALDDPKAAKRFLARMETEVDALTQMTQELLELTRIESGQVPLDLRAVKAGKLLESSVERMRAQAERAGLELTAADAGDLPEIRADAMRLEQVLVNLIHNAIKFTRPGGKVTLTAEQDGQLVRFGVQDTGSGIPADELPRIFERFYKADRARSGGGTGLGLSIARHIVEAHGGKIWADSLEGQGSTFRFTIPTC